MRLLFLSDLLFKLDEGSGNIFSAFRFPHAQLSKQLYALLFQKWFPFYHEKLGFTSLKIAILRKLDQQTEFYSAPC
jgi:hypothetical protein